MLQRFRKTIGKVAAVPLERFYVDVRILDVKTTYGRIRFYVEPIAGSGRFWVQSILAKPLRDYGSDTYTFDLTVPEPLTLPHNSVI